MPRRKQRRPDSSKAKPGAKTAKGKAGKGGEARANKSKPKKGKAAGGADVKAAPKGKKPSASGKPRKSRSAPKS